VEAEARAFRLHGGVTVEALSVARAYQVSGDVTGASESAVASVIAPLRASGNRYAGLLRTTNLARLHVLQGRLRQAASTYEEARETVSESGEMQGSRDRGHERGGAFSVV
jgi:hypothetical protein